MDVDGVIVGKKRGVNFPLPNPIVIQKLKELSQKGIPVILCTAKFNYAIHGIIKSAELKNPHITDGGALIIDLLADKIIKKSVFNKKLAENVAKNCLAENIYLETYGIENYFLQKFQINNFTQNRAELLQKDPQMVDSLIEQIDQSDIIKFIGFVEQEENKIKIEKALYDFRTDVNLMWSAHPAFPHMKFGI